LFMIIRNKCVGSKWQAGGSLWRNSRKWHESGGFSCTGTF
jgi:hypothetical protein